MQEDQNVTPDYTNPLAQLFESLGRNRRAGKRVKLPVQELPIQQTDYSYSNPPDGTPLE